jgi:hypothetical protein
MKRATRAAAVSVGLVLSWACGFTEYVTTTAVGSGRLATESRPVHGFTAVAVSGAGHLIIEQTGVESLQVTAEDNILPFVLTEVRGGRLHLGFEPGVSIHATRRVEYRLTVAELSDIEGSGASRVEVVHLDTRELTTRISGASSYTAAGIADDHRIDLSGASRCEAGDLVSRDVTASLSGASRCLVHVQHRLVVSASGASTLEYIGHPAVEANVSGGSVVRPLLCGDGRQRDGC